MSAAKEIKYFFLNTLLTSIIFYFLDFYTKTLRVQLEGTEKIQKHLENGGRVIMASWHQRFFGGFFLPQIFKWSPCIMISKSRDGDFISKVVSHIGWIPVRGSSSRGGREALRAMVQEVNENKIGGQALPVRPASSNQALSHWLEARMPLFVRPSLLMKKPGRRTVGIVLWCPNHSAGFLSALARSFPYRK
jgi:hypothetical protein